MLAFVFFLELFMKPRIVALIFGLLMAGGVDAEVQAPLETSGTTVVVPAFGEVRRANDEARLTFMVEEQDKERSAAVDRVNRKMQEGTAILKREDPGAVLQTRGYFTYPIYADEGTSARPLERSQPVQRQIVGWRVGQYLDMKTSNLDILPRTVVAAQRVLALNGLQFGLKEETEKKLEQERIAAAYANLVERVNAIAKAMGRSPADVQLEVVDFEGSGNYAPQTEGMQRMTMMSAKAMDAGNIAEPSFEPGETTLSMRVVGRARFR